VAKMLFSITTNPHLVLLIMIVFLMIIGCFMETAASLIILVPILVPMTSQLGIDPLVFGLIMVFTLMLGLITPPVGVVLYLIADIAGISFERTVKATFPFLLPLIIVLLLITFVPQIAMFLPNWLLP
jgi:TRAP-type C4-dicarboxylate transport system permease large subunit